MKLSALLLAVLLAVQSTAWAADPTVEELLDHTDDVARGASSVGTMQMHVKTASYDRTVQMKIWTIGTEKSLIVIELPEKEKGTSTLKVDENIWNYLPKVDRTMKVPASMMSGAWMGSHLTNDDLVKESRLREDFTYKLVKQPSDGGEWVIELVAKPDAPVVWGRVVVRISADELPREIAYYDERGALVRTMSFSDVRSLGGRELPTRIRISPAEEPGEYTEIIYVDIAFDVEIPESRFTLQALKP